MLIGMFYRPSPYLYKVEVCIYVSAWASGVARSVGVGNAKALYSGTSDEVQTLTLFSYLCLPKTIIRNLFCRRGTKHHLWLSIVGLWLNQIEGL